MNDHLDYEHVSVVLSSNVDALVEPPQEFDLGFSIGSTTATLPFLFYYSDELCDERFEDACAAAGVLSCGPADSKIPFVGYQQNAPADAVCCLYETLDVASPTALADVRKMLDSGLDVVVGCSVDEAHGYIVSNELRVASALLVGATQPNTFKVMESLGMSTPRVTLTRALSQHADVPVIATVGSASEACKAFVAGADAVLINLGGPFAPEDDVKMYVEAATSSLKASVEELCRLARVSKHTELRFKCRLTNVS